MRHIDACHTARNVFEKLTYDSLIMRMTKICQIKCFILKRYRIYEEVMKRIVYSFH